MRTIDKIITNVSSSRGAPMGRDNIDERPAKDGFVLPEYLENKKNRLYDCAVPMDSSGAYDRGGAYWGTGRQLRVKYSKDLLYIEFYRMTRHQVIERLTNASRPEQR